MHLPAAAAAAATAAVVKSGFEVELNINGIHAWSSAFLPGLLNRNLWQAQDVT